MDPKKSLEGFRVETSRPQKKVSRTPKQTYKKSNAILIILFASLIGLTSGIGSAFAFGIKEMPPPLDEPSAESPVDQVEPSIKKAEVKTPELSPQKPPIDEPTVETSPVEEPVKKEEKVKDPPVIKHEKVESKKLEKQQDTKEIDKSADSKKHSSAEYKSKSEQKSTSAPTIPADQESTVATSISKPASSEGKAQQTVPSGQTEKQTVHNKAVSGNQPEASDTHTQIDSKSISTDQVASSEETPDPQTKPGVLPDTAGNDLNHAVASLVIVCFSIAYLLARKETHPQK